MKSKNAFDFTYDEKTSPNHHSLHFHIQIHGELDAKVVRVRKRFPEKACPLLTDFTNFTDFIHRQNLQRATEKKSR